ncbi:GNAT family N-acetyltransferase [Oceanirhabdus seepicola]|uniref:GNAT family N-acetyltransferase n=1 Tax=Oceanirhabdus seepicola TaxID=2828781 RepID=A0A9J6P025_9CLOT|nr:GNAT family N-acetyltransferase [Oceanirhabdus seepicola]MCM1989221.1 GNAT family N-acetyltransferase [Oceanirhabdus seepicola]
MYENLRIETDRLVIRNFTNADIGQLYRIVNNETIMKYVPFAEERTLEECEELMKRILNRYRESTISNFKGFLLLVVSKDNNECVGFVGLFPLSYDITETELFYGLFEEHYSKGFATEIGKAIIEYGFKNMNINKIVATVNKDNEVSKRVLDKMGMCFECEIEDEEAKDSSYDGELLYSINRI